jgi:hypothetical protein
MNQFHRLFFITGVDLIDRMLSFDHRKRSTTEEALGKVSF